MCILFVQEATRGKFDSPQSQKISLTLWRVKLTPRAKKGLGPCLGWCGSIRLVMLSWGTKGGSVKNLKFDWWWFEEMKHTHTRVYGHSATKIGIAIMVMSRWKWLSRYIFRRGSIVCGRWKADADANVFSFVCVSPFGDPSKIRISLTLCELGSHSLFAN